MPRQPISHLLQIIVSGAKNYTIQSYYNGVVVPDPLPVVVGDRVAFFVQVKLQFGRLAPAYEIVFKDPKFFGVSSIAVPAGGVSEFVQVRTVKGKVSYTLNVGGIGVVFDPEIQSGSDGPGPGPFRPIPDDPKGGIARVRQLFTVTWDVGLNILSCVTAGKQCNWPMHVSVLDVVTFVATNVVGKPSQFLINFTVNNGCWGSPFSVDGNSIPAVQPDGLSTAPNPVEDNVDTTPVSFPIVATITLDGIMHASPSDPKYAIHLN